MLADKRPGADKRPAAKRRPWVDEWPGEALRTTRGELFVRHAPPAGTGLPLAVFVHGLGGSSINWTDLMAAVRDVVDGYAPDLPGCGRSPTPVDRVNSESAHFERVYFDGAYSLDAQARSVAALIEALGRPAHLVGLSMGGPVAVRVAASRPDLVRTLTLISPAMPDLRPPAAAARMPVLLLPVVGRALVRAFERMPLAQRTAAVLRLCTADPSLLPRVRVEQEMDLLRLRATSDPGGRVFRAMLRGLVRAYVRRGRRSIWREAGRVRAPTLVVQGTRDRLVRPGLADRVALVFAVSRLLLLPDCGHLAQLERPDLVALAFRELVADGGLLAGASETPTAGMSARPDTVIKASPPNGGGVAAARPGRASA